VLAFAAKKLGASRVVAVDNDPVSVQLAKEAALENDIEDVDLSTKPLAKISGTFDLVVANILANTLIELAGAIVAKVGKRLVLAGILAPQAEAVTAEYVRRGLTALPPAADGEWVRLDFERRMTR
jgi:ribosomal protein L11 methyltransferase